MCVKNKIKDLLNSGDVPEDHKIVLITHWSFLKLYTSDYDSLSIDEDGGIHSIVSIFN